MRNDPVRELIARILDAANREGTLTESIALEVERSFRHDYNGEVCYIKERTGDTITSKKTAVVAAYLQNQPVEQITQHHGISRATLYRYLKK